MSWGFFSIRRRSLSSGDNSTWGCEGSPDLTDLIFDGSVSSNLLIVFSTARLAIARFGSSSSGRAFSTRCQQAMAWSNCRRFPRAIPQRRFSSGSSDLASKAVFRYNIWHSENSAPP